MLLEDPEFQALAKEFHTKISLTQVQALIQALIMYAHQLLQVGESAEEVFAKLFAKQEIVCKTTGFRDFLALFSKTQLCEYKERIEKC